MRSRQLLAPVSLGSLPHLSTMGVEGLKCAVTGGNGFVGRRLVEMLVERGAKKCVVKLLRLQCQLLNLFYGAKLNHAGGVSSTKVLSPDIRPPGLFRLTSLLARRTHLRVLASSTSKGTLATLRMSSVSSRAQIACGTLLHWLARSTRLSATNVSTTMALLMSSRPARSRR